MPRWRRGADWVSAVRPDTLEQRVKRHVEPASQPRDREYAWLPLSALDARNVRDVEAGGMREILLRQPAVGAESSYVGREGVEGLVPFGQAADPTTPRLSAPAPVGTASIWAPMPEIAADTAAAVFREAVVKNFGEVHGRARKVFEVFGIESPTNDDAQRIRAALADAGLVTTPELDADRPKARIRVRLADRGATVKVGSLPGRTGNSSGTLAWLDECQYQGGHGYELTVGREYGLVFGDDAVRIPLSPLEPIAYTDILGLEIGGPGATTQGGGFLGGGFGVQGFLQGAVLATAMNSATTRTSISTYVGIRGTHGEAIFHHTIATPGQVTIALSAVFGRLRELQAPTIAPTQNDDPAERIERLADMLDRGLITTDEFHALKADILRRLGA
jgi:hypothetical protein